jgi:TrmH family RNA methyltransferase
MALITSLTNPRIREVRSLGQRKRREAAGLCVAEGIFHVGEALGTGDVAYLIYAPDLLVSDFGRALVAGATAQNVPVYPVTPEVMASVAAKDNPQGLLAVVRQRRARLEDLSPATHPWLTALVAPQDPGNVGAILRTLDAVGASGLLLLDGGVDPYHPAAIRAGMGATFHLPLASASFEAFVEWARVGGYHVYGTSARGRTDYRAATAYSTPLALLMGSEREGLSADQSAACDELIRLPMHGRARSLNLAVATGVFLYAIHDSLAEQGYFESYVGR